MKMNQFNRIFSLLIFVVITTAGTLLAGELYDKVTQNDIEAVKKLLAAGAEIKEQVEVGFRNIATDVTSRLTDAKCGRASVLF